LVATLVYKNHLRENSDNSFIPAADEFENLAVQILNKFYETNPALCTRAIIRQIPAYGNATWLEIAVAAGAKQFISQRAVQDVLNNIWFVRTNLSNTNILKEIFPIGMDTLIKKSRL
jgi:hypothetical protein